MFQQIQREIEADEQALSQLLTDLTQIADPFSNGQRLVEFQRLLGAHHLAQEEMIGRLEREAQAVSRKQCMLVEQMHQVLDNLCCELVQQLGPTRLFLAGQRELLSLLFENSITFKTTEIWSTVDSKLSDTQQLAYAKFYRQREIYHRKTL